MKDFARFLALVGFILMSLFLVWNGARNYGLSQPPNSYQTELVRSLSSSTPTQPILWTTNAPHQHSTIVFKDDQWRVKETGQTINQFYVRPEIKSHLVFFELDSPIWLPDLRKQFSENNIYEKIIFCSRNDGNLKDLRELEPRWTFCSGEVFLTRFLALHSLGLSSLLTISADVFYIHLTHVKADESLQSLIDEANRQGKIVIVGPVSRPSKSLSPQGWMVDNGDQKVDP